MDMLQRIEAVLKPDLDQKFTVNGAHPFKPAAVLIPLIKRNSSYDVLLTKRSELLKHHAGQISFPGGRIEAGETHKQAALRETHEEIGTPPEQITVLGRLPLYHTGTGYEITPWVGILSPPIKPILNKDEVEAIFYAPLDYLMQENHYRQETKFNRNGKSRRFHCLDWQTHHIWGATAGILLNLAHSIK